MKTLFERYLADSVKKFEEVQGKPLTINEMLNIFFPQKFARVESELHLDSNAKTAFVLVGRSCSGKSSYAINFQKAHPEFSVVSMDECAIEDLRTMSADELLQYSLSHSLHEIDAGNHRFGIKLEKGNQHIIVDGGWLHINARGALLKTLSELGYETTIISFLEIPEETLIERIEERELSMMAMSFLGEHDILNTLHQDYIAKYAYNLGISRHQAVLMLKGNRKYPENIFMAKLSHFYDEKDCMYQMQYKCKMFMFGADHIYTLTNF